jgi:hypothetical protein
MAARQDIILEDARAGEETAESALWLDQRKERELFIHSYFLLIDPSSQSFASLMGLFIVSPMTRCSTAVPLQF